MDSLPLGATLDCRLIFDVIHHTLIPTRLPRGRGGCIPRTGVIPMTTIIKEAIASVAVSWSVAAYAIWKWGPGLRKRSVRCPERNLQAKVLADQREAEFGSLRVVDIKECSLLTAAHPICSKQCRASF